MSVVTRLPNNFQAHDPRFDGLLKLAYIVEDEFDHAHGDTEGVISALDDPDTWPCARPLELAQLLREAAERIESTTEDAEGQG